MKFPELLSKLDKSPGNEDWVCVSSLCRELNIDEDSFYNHDRVRVHFAAYWIATWQCTDTQVGVSALFMNGLFVATLTQSARKSDIVYEWASVATYNRVHEFMLSLIEPDTQYVKVLDMSGEYDGYKLRYTEQVFQKEWDCATYRGLAFKVIKKFFWMDAFTQKELDDVKLYHSKWGGDVMRAHDYVKIATDYGRHRVVPIEAIEFKYRINI